MYESLEVLDGLRMNFTGGGLLLMNIAIGFIMFGVAIDIKREQFSEVLRSPKTVILGLVAQFVLLPLVTFLALWLARDYVTPSIAFGCILVAACPGGNISNFITNMARGNTALAVSLTAIGTMLAVVMTPFNFELYGKLYMSASPLNVPVEIRLLDVLRTVFILLGIPIMLGTLMARKLPKVVDKIRKPIKILSIIIFLVLVIMAFRENYTFFLKYIKYIFIIVFIHNALVFLSSYWFARSFRLMKNDCRTISIESAIQNSGLALALIFNPKIFPPELQVGGMAFIAAWWGIWHIVAGMGVAAIWRTFPAKGRA